MTTDNPVALSTSGQNRHSLALPILTGAFGVSVVLWSTWFATHLPWLGVREQVALPLLLVLWILGTAWFVGRFLRGGLVPGALLGLATAGIGLLLVGTKLAEKLPDQSAARVRPNALLMIAGFLALGALVGLVGSVVAKALAGSRGHDSPSASSDAWLGRFALVTVASIFPLLIVGGMVTSTNSGMAVPDWPNTFGSNMFLYPLGPNAKPDVFFEHSHRLFATFVGLTTIVLTALVFLCKSRTAVKVAASVALLLIIVQGVFGGLRVVQGNPVHDLDDRVYKIVHGVLSQVFLASAVLVAALVSRAARDGDGIAVVKSEPNAKRVRIFANAALHTTLLQLVFGAMYRHLRDGKGGGHALMSHMALSVVVVVLAALAASAAVALRSNDPLAQSLRKAGKVLFLVFTIQFALGWITWAVGGKTFEVQPWQAVLRTSHQTNGALLLALVTWMAVLGKRIPKRV